MAVTLALIVSVGAVSAQEKAPLHPKIYKSASGEYSLAVDPRHRFGAGPANYRFSKKAVLQWEKNFEFTFQDCIITNSGVIAGYSYSHGRQLRFDPADLPGVTVPSSDLRIVMLNQDGESMISDSRPRRLLPSTIGFPSLTPSVEALMYNEMTNRIIIRILSDALDETWRVYSLDSSSPKIVAESSPWIAMGSPAEWDPTFLDARILGGTPFTIVVLGGEGASGKVNNSIRIAAIDSEGKVAWQKDLPEDRVGVTSVLLGSIVSIDPPGVFTIRSYAEKSQFTIQARRDEKGVWIFDEIKQIPDALVPSAAPARDEDRYQKKIDAFTEIGLDSLSPLLLNINRGSWIGDTLKIAATSDGGVALLREQAKDATEFVLMNSAGKMIFTKSLREALPKFDTPRHFFEKSPGIFIVSYESSSGLILVKVDVPAKEVAVVATIDVDIKSAASVFPDGSIVFVSSGEAAFVSPDYKVIKSVTIPIAEIPFSVAALTDGTIAVPDRGSVYIINRDGFIVNKFSMVNCRFVAPGPGGRFFTTDGVKIYEYFAGGEHGETLHIHDAVGRGPSFVTAFVPSPDGNFYLMGDYGMIKVRDDGLSALFAGSLVSKLDFYDLAGAVVNLDRIYLLSLAGGAATVFDKNGKNLYSCNPGLQEIPRGWAVSDAPPVITGDGDVYFCIYKQWLPAAPIEWLSYNSKGVFMGVQKLAWAPNPPMRWNLFPGSATRVLYGSGLLKFESSRGDVINNVVRLPTEQWLNGAASGGFCKDGSIGFLLNAVRGADSSIYQYVAGVYDKNGKLKESIIYPESEAPPSRVMMRFDERYIITMLADRIYISKRNGGSVGYFTLEHRPGEYLYTISVHGDELWIQSVEARKLQLDRYSLKEIRKPGK